MLKLGYAMPKETRREDLNYQPILVNDRLMAMMMAIAKTHPGDSNLLRKARNSDEFIANASAVARLSVYSWSSEITPETRITLPEIHCFLLEYLNLLSIEQGRRTIVGFDVSNEADFQTLHNLLRDSGIPMFHASGKEDRMNRILLTTVAVCRLAREIGAYSPIC